MVPESNSLPVPAQQPNLATNIGLPSIGLLKWNWGQLLDVQLLFGAKIQYANHLRPKSEQRTLDSADFGGVFNS